jgi:hypothetical protein
MTVTPSPPSDPAVLFHLGGARSTATGSRFRHGFGTADLNLSTLPSWLAMRRSGSSYRTWRAKRTSQTDEAMENDTRRLSPHCAVYARIGGSVSQGPLSLSCGATSVRNVGGPRRRSGNGQFDAGSAIDVCARGAKGLVLVPGGWGRLGSTNVLLAAVTKRLLRAVHPDEGIPLSYFATREAGYGPGLPTCVLHKVVSYLEVLRTHQSGDRMAP